MKSITLIILLFALAITAKGENSNFPVEEREDAIQDIQELTEEREGNLIGKDSDEEIEDEDPIRKVNQFTSFQELLESRRKFTSASNACLPP